MTLSAIWPLLLGKWAPELIITLFGHNLHHMAPFGILEAGFCMVFRPASSFFFCPGDPFLDLGTKIWTRDLEIGPGLARGGFWNKHGGPKNMVLRGDGLQIGDYGISRDPNGLYGTQEAFGRAGLPQNPTRKLFLGDFPYLGNLW